MTRGTPDIDRPAAVAALMAELLGRGSAVRLQVTGRSMGPLVPSGSTVLLRPAAPETLRPGDIVMFQNALGAPVLHRIVRVDRDAAGRSVFRTKGDALIAFDDPVLPGQVLGRAVQIEGPFFGGRRRRADLCSRRWRWAGRVIAFFQLHVSKALLKLGSSRKSG